MPPPGCAKLTTRFGRKRAVGLAPLILFDCWPLTLCMDKRGVAVAIDLNVRRGCFDSTLG
jgi:hypothetical protein